MEKKPSPGGYCDRCGKLLKGETDVNVVCEDCDTPYRICQRCQKEGCPDCGGRLKPEKPKRIH